MRVGILQGYLQIDGENLRTIPACREDRNAFYGGGSPHNMGDWFVTRSIWSELDAEVYYTVHPAAPQKSFDFINSECDVFVLKGGNFLTGNFLSTKIGYEVLSKIKIPMMYIGAGLQAPIGGTVTFTEDEQRCLKYIHDSSESCGVRGETSKEALEKIGITNARVITCPTLFWGCKPELELKKPSMERVGWTMRDVLLSQDRPTQKRQFDLIERLRDHCRELIVMLQGEETLLQEYFLADRWGQTRRTQRAAVEGYEKLQKSTQVSVDIEKIEKSLLETYANRMTPDMIRWVMRHSFYSYDPAEYLDFFKSLDLMVGCRLHGNLVSMAWGTPAFYVTYDERTQEMVEALKIPSAKITDTDFDPASAVHADWAPFQERYKHYYQEYKSFLEQNLLKHKLA